MSRALLFAAAFAAQSAFAIFGIETDPDKITAQWKKDAIEAIAKHRDAKERIKAAETLGGNVDPESVMALAGGLSDREASVRQAAANALWRSGKASAPARAQLVAALDDADPNVVARAAGALQMIGMTEAELVPARKRVFAAPDAAIDSRFLVSRNLFGHEEGPRLVAAMVPYLERNAARGDAGRQNTALAEQALVGLAKTQDPSIVAPLMQAARNAKAGQPVLLKAMAEFKVAPDGMTDLAVALLDSPDRNVRHAALGAMRKLTRQKDVEVWAPRAAGMLRDPDASVRSEALWALGNAGGLAAGEIEKVVAALGDSNENVRGNAARVIGEMGDTKLPTTAASKARVAQLARPALAAMVERESNADARGEAKTALAKLAPEGPAAGATLAAASPTSPAAEVTAMNLLRERKVTFEPTSFFKALHDGDVALVQAFLDAGMSANAPIAAMGPPLQVMLFSSQACSPQKRPTKAEAKQLVKLLLDRGADPNGADANRNSALMAAAMHGCDRELMRMLIKAGANINAKNASGHTAFEAGLYWGHDGLEEIVAAGYRLPAEKVKAYEQGYAGRAEAQAMIKKAKPK